MSRFAIASPDRLITYHEHNEERAGRKILEHLSWHKDVALCSNAGYPGVSDPGYRIISETIEAGHEVVVIPGADAVHSALLSSGLPTSSYTFKGFPPRRPGPRRRFLEAEAAMPHTLVIFESPHRLGAFLAVALDVLGDRRAALCIELTKRFEKVHRGYLKDLAAAFAEEKVRGEVTVVIAGNHAKLIRTSEGDPTTREIPPPGTDAT